jgi:ribonuclease T1
MKSWIIYCIFILAIASMTFGSATRPALAETCMTVVKELNRSLDPRIDERELAGILRTLNETGNQRLPPKFVTKNQAKKLGWKPGRDLWDYRGLKGKSIGGDFFANREGRLPNGKRVWHEADLAYKGGHRGAKRIVYSDDGLRMVTVDHYRTFREVPPCQ